ncbi:peptidoglycan-binding protein [Streptomyces sp. NPDC005828]|uniref:peptidoglycan-binding domain-containing protein n=1 Tax=Streptomyces sp. NPDC005828 TaxID=3157071 RepID=UPI00340C8F53
MSPNDPPDGIGTPILKQGSDGPAVRKLQQLLNEHVPDLPSLAVDGDFGPVTDGRVREYQRRVEIAVDGVVGPQTWGMLTGGEVSQEAAVGTPTLQQGAHGPAVRKVQRLLNAHVPDLQQLAVDGRFGPVTDGRVREFQGRVAIAVDGIVGPQTWGHLTQGLATQSLESARFRGDPVLEQIRAGVTSSYLKFGQSGAHVVAVQNALIDLGPRYAIPSGATGFFGNETSAAVIKYKQDEGLSPADPVVGQGTISHLDAAWSLPYADREEWLSWKGRPLPAFNFTRKDEKDRLDAGLSFTFNPVCGSIPQVFRDAIVAALIELLDPRGSPDGAHTPSATWGASPVDFYHFHLAVDQQPVPADPSWFGIDTLQAKAKKLNERADELKAKADLVAQQGSPAWTTAYRALLLTPTSGGTKGMADLFIEMLEEARANSLVTHQNVRLIWHTFESPQRRPASVTSLAPRRHWRNTLLPTPSALSHPPFVPTPSNNVAHFFNFAEPAFLVDKNRVITVFGPTITETAALVGLDLLDIIAAFGAPPTT